jgi:hypothetical protein
MGLGSNFEFHTDSTPSSAPVTPATAVDTGITKALLWGSINAIFPTGQERVLLHQSDTLPPLDARLTDGDGTPADLRGTVVQFAMRPAARRSRNVLMKQVEVLQADPGQLAAGASNVQYNWEAEDTVHCGDYLGVFVVLDGSGRQTTYPNNGSIKITIGNL